MKKVFLSILAIMALSSTVEAAGFGGQVKDSNPLTNPIITAKTKEAILFEKVFAFDCVWFISVSDKNKNYVTGYPGQQWTNDEASCKDFINDQIKKYTALYPEGYTIENTQH